MTTETSYLLLQGTASKMIWEIDERIEEEWHTGDEWHELRAKRDRLSRFKDYLELHKQFNP